MIGTASPFPTWRRYQVILGGLIAAAWLTLAVAALTPYAGLLDHHAIEEGSFSAAVRWPAFFASWTLMVVAMMLPGSLPAVRSFVEAGAAGDAKPAWRLPLYLAGYLLIWAAFGAALYQGDTFLHEAVHNGLLPHEAEHLIPVVLLAVAGLYQFTPLKRRCLESHGAGHAEGSALYGGLRAGTVCVGTCGAAMLVMFALGGGVNLAFMAALAVVTVVERTTAYGRYTSWLLAYVLLVWAWLMLVL
jgi:predicted metal-binding membrane protein